MSKRKSSSSSDVASRPLVNGTPSITSQAEKKIDAPQFAVEWMPLEALKEYAQNARKITDAAVDKVARSLAEFGWRQPLVVDPKHVLIAGHTRRRAALQLGWKLAPVHVAHNLTAEQVRAYRLMDNRSHDESSWDNDLLKVEIGELRKLSLDLTLTGFDVKQLERLMDTATIANPQLGAMEYRIVVKCDNEEHQRTMLGKLQSEGYQCQALIS